jgi:3-isopropylmalate/(R)-2-methylmalate dehydratase small subunit
MKIRGRVHKYGSNVNTDVILPAQYLHIADAKELAKHCMEDLDRKFAKEVQPGDIIVGEVNFGCGSSREHAPIAIKASGIGCVIAKNFGRIFYRNALNIGLPILESEEVVEGLDNGDQVEVDLTTGIVVNVNKRKRYQAKPYPEFMMQLITAGGLIEYTKRRLAKQSPSSG